MLPPEAGNWLDAAGEWSREENEAQLREMRRRIRVLSNRVEGLKVSRKKKSKKEKVDRNLLSRLPQQNADLGDALFECYQMARRGKLKTVDEWNFEVFWRVNLAQLAVDIKRRQWKPSSSKAFVTHTPVDREIFAAPFRDRIVHHLLYAVVAPWWEKRFIYDSYSCRRGRGTKFGVERMQKFMLAASKNGTQEAYIIKGDLSGFFMSMKRGLLYKKVMTGLKRQFPNDGWLFEMCEYLWREVIFDDPCRDARIVGNKSNWEVLPDSKTLFKQPAGQGIVIGNLTSQLLSNIMLNEFDWFMKKTLGFRWYGRYVDDFFVVVPKAELKRTMELMRTRVPEKLRGMGLKLHPKKKYVQEVSHGCPFLGEMVRPFVRTPGERYLKNMRKAFWQYAKGEVGYDTVQSYIGMGQNMAAYAAMKKVVAKLEAEFGAI